MIDSFLQPSRIKALLIGGGTLLVVALGLLTGCVYLSGKLDAERAGHKTTRLERDNAVKEGLGWKAAAEAANEQREALRAAVNECLGREREAREDAAERAKILRDAVPVIRPPERGLPQASPVTAGGNKNEIIVDDATRAKAMDRLNRPL